MFFTTSNLVLLFLFFFFNDTATTEIYTLSLHDALPIWQTRTFLRDGDGVVQRGYLEQKISADRFLGFGERTIGDRKSTRLNSSHLVISYAVFCLKKKIIVTHDHTTHSHYTFNETYCKHV